MCMCVCMCACVRVYFLKQHKRSFKLLMRFNNANYVVWFYKVTEEYTSVGQENAVDSISFAGK
jgi:hypothetical protein